MCAVFFLFFVFVRWRDFYRHFSCRFGREDVRYADGGFRVVVIAGNRRKTGRTVYKLYTKTRAYIIILFSSRCVIIIERLYMPLWRTRVVRLVSFVRSTRKRVYPANIVFGGEKKTDKKRKKSGK